MKQVRSRSVLGVLAAVALAGAALVGASGCPGDSSCEVDADCSGERVCARSHECLLLAQVRRVQVRWTVGGAAASEATCAPVEPLAIEFAATREDVLKYEPLACAAGLFTIDKMPSRLTTVRVTGAVSAASGIPSDGQVQLDLR